MTTAACVVLVTCGSPEEADRIAGAVVAERLAACVNVVGRGAPVRSFYIWDGAMQCEDEVLLILKTLASRLPALEARIKALHGYSVPEFIALPVMAGSAEYLEWLGQTVDFA